MRYARVALDSGPAWVRWEGADGVLLDGAPWAAPRAVGRVPRAGTALLAPWGGTKIVAIGSNYRAHAAEMGKPVPSVPRIFLKAPSAVCDPGAPVEIPPRTVRVDHEAELAVVIGRRCRRVSAAAAMDHVFGLTAANDVTARDFQKEDGVFARAKGFDSFCPLGPELVTGVDPRDLVVRARVNGQLRQDGRTSDMVFDLPTLLAFVSEVMTLEPGDVLLTGTPAGVGPLVAGDRVEVEIEGIGVLANPVIDRADR